ncbi:ABC transporter substrate-binding protein [Schinkia azotoformans]|uniref:ABC transporter substrate-binding protein n=1 Tax=Schinkia azotoformans TaxID=1454 RepID=UPI002DBB90E2|nr:ABC transporter substrate-binding protein [Schinkia azotoformans]MEC1721645.1 ABC transporter substrate-binding protein [Schinkia azotoformans]MED4352123.1 ABC transporter substrate-binding protein [Schinkia azotoformans]MED4415089.1 ABC transporter substrate-binding protein [Schinkia azotoformans]
MNKLLKSIKLLLLVGVLITSLVACGAEGSEQSSGNKTNEKRTIKIGYLPITHAVPLYIEKEQAKYQNFDLELIKFGSWTELVDALNTGRIDGASMLVTLAMKAKEQGIDLKAVALGHRDGNVLITANNITSVQDLKGKNFAIPHKFSTHNILLYQMLKQNGLKYEEINPIELPPAEMPAALSEGRIDGYVVAEPFGAVSVAINKGKVLVQDNQVWKNSIDCALVLRGDFINNENAIAQEFVDYYVEAGYTAEHKDQSTQEMSLKYMKVEKDVMDLSFKWIKYDNLKIQEEDYKELTNSLVEMGLQENPPTFADFVDNSLIDKAK